MSCGVTPPAPNAHPEGADEKFSLGYTRIRGGGRGGLSLGDPPPPPRDHHTLGGEIAGGGVICSWRCTLAKGRGGTVVHRVCTVRMPSIGLGLCPQAST